MRFPQQTGRETYRVVVRKQEAADLLLLAADDHRLFLPSVKIPRWQRVAASLIAAVKNELGCEVLCLFTRTVNPPPHPSGERRYQVMECCGGPGNHDHRARWVPISSLSQHSFTDPNDYLAVRQCLAEWDAYARGPAPGPFAKPGWFGELRSWVEAVTGPLGLHLTNRFSQLNASPSFSLIWFESDGPAIWFKAVGAPNVREFAITSALAQLLPKYIPPILAVQSKWNGWLTLEVAGIHLEEAPDPELWMTAATALANLQIDSIDKHPQLLAAGARDLTASTLADMIGPFLGAMAQLMKQQSKSPPIVLTTQELSLLGEHVLEALSLIRRSGIPETVGHLDLNPGNVIVSHSECKFLDWAEAYVGHPFLTFEYLRENFRRSVGAHPELETQLVAAYSEPWRALLSDDAVSQALALTPLLAVFAYAAGTDVWSDQEKLQQPATAGYLRSLTRRLQRESGRLAAGTSNA